MKRTQLEIALRPCPELGCKFKTLPTDRVECARFMERLASVVCQCSPSPRRLSGRHATSARSLWQGWAPCLGGAYRRVFADKAIGGRRLPVVSHPWLESRNRGAYRNVARHGSVIAESPTVAFHVSVCSSGRSVRRCRPFKRPISRGSHRTPDHAIAPLTVSLFFFLDTV